MNNKLPKLSKKKTEKPLFLMIAGEPSGDVHGANLIKEIKKKFPDGEFFGIGGELMENEGMKILVPLEKMAILGFVEVIKHLPFMKQVFKMLIEEVQRRKPAAVILIDYPGFNIRFAKKIRKFYPYELKILYYISPQVWAWKKNRVKTIAKNVDTMAVVFPFEEEIYSSTGMNVKFVGHPLLDLVKPSMGKEPFFERHTINAEKKCIGLLPGSRKQEIEKHLILMIEAVDLLREKFPGIQAVVGKSREIPEEFYKDVLAGKGDKFVLTEDVYDLMHHADFIISASGTATLETGLSGTPLTIIYKMSPLSFIIAKRMVKLPFIGLINIVLNKKVAPELIQHDATAANIANTVDKYLSDPKAYNEFKEALKEAKSRLGEPGASERVAGLVQDLVS